MPQIFPVWMSSPLFTYVLYGVMALLVLQLIRLIIRRNWRGLGRHVGTLTVLGLIGFTGFNGYVKYLFKDFQWQMPPATILSQTVVPKTFDDRIEAVGTTQANESTALTANVSETIKEILFTEGQFVTAGTLIARLHDDQERASLVEAERAYNRSAELVRTGAVSKARLDTDRARLDVIRAQLRDRQITAPFDGILGLRSLSVGDIVNPGTVITTLDDVDPMKLEFSIPEADMAAIKFAQKIEARTEAYKGQIFKGVITALDPRIDPATRALRVKAEIQNENGQLRAGMLMTVDIISNPRTGLAVSEEALISQGQQKSVRVLGTPDDAGLSTVENRPVTIGTRRPGYVEITSGLKENEKIVVDGVIKAFPGSKVKIGGEKNIAATIETAIENAVAGKQDDLKNSSMGTQKETASEKSEELPDTLPVPETTPDLAPTTPVTE